MKPQTNLWPLGLIVTFILFFCGMTVVVSIAATHREDLVSPDYYEHELQYQDQINAANRAQKSGATVRYDAGVNQVAIRLPAAQLALHPTGIIQFYRPSAPELDSQIVLSPRADGVQLLDVSKMAAGNWSISVSWKAGTEDYYLAQKLVLGK